MLNLAEYRKKTVGLCDYLPWACLIGPGIVLNKDGSFQCTLRYRGPDLDSATEAELVSITARLNNVLKRFGDGWALFFEAERVPANQYPGARFADPASWLVATRPSAPTAPTTRAAITSPSCTCHPPTARDALSG
jgi:type IV secretion system protein VirB4